MRRGILLHAIFDCQQHRCACRCSGASTRRARRSTRRGSTCSARKRASPSTTPSRWCALQRFCKSWHDACCGCCLCVTSAFWTHSPRRICFACCFRISLDELVALAHYVRASGGDSVIMLWSLASSCTGFCCAGCCMSPALKVALSEVFCLKVLFVSLH